MESDLKKRIEALRMEAEEQTRKGQLDRAAQIQFGELPRLEEELKRMTDTQNGTHKASEIIEVRIRGLMMDPSTSMPIVVLKDVASETVMPIWLGIFEANSIALEIEKVAAPRPMPGWNVLLFQNLRMTPFTRPCGFSRGMSPWF